MGVITSELELDFMDYLWGAGGLDCQSYHRQELAAGLLDEYYCRDRWRIPRWVGLHTDYRSPSHGWLELDAFIVSVIGAVVLLALINLVFGRRLK